MIEGLSKGQCHICISVKLVRMSRTLPRAASDSSSLRQQASKTTCALMLTLSAPPMWNARGAE